MPPVFLTGRRELAFEIETTPGTEEAGIVTGTQSDILVYDAVWTPDITMFQRTPQKFHTGPLGDLAGQRMARLSFRVELRRTNIGGTADKWMDLLQGCGFSVTAASATNIYTPTSLTPGLGTGEQKTLTMHLFTGGANSTNAPRYTLTGAMGNVRFTGSIGQPMFAEFEFMGVHQNPTDDIMNSVTHESAKPAVFQGVTMTLGGDSFVFGNFNLNMNNSVQMREDASQASGYITAIVASRRPEFQFNPEVVDLATKNFVTTLTGNSEQALSLVHDYFTFAIPKAQLTAISEEDDNGVSRYGLTGVCNANTDDGDDEITLTIGGP